MRGGQGSRINDACGRTSQLKFVQDVSGDFVVRKSGIVVMDGDSLAQCFVNGLAEGIIEVGFSTQNQREVIHRIPSTILGMISWCSRQSPIWKN